MNLLTAQMLQAILIMEIINKLFLICLRAMDDWLTKNPQQSTRATNTFCPMMYGAVLSVTQCDW